MKLEISELQFADMLKSEGFTVKRIDTPVEFKLYHGRSLTNIIPVLHVISPITDNAIPLTDLFKTYIKVLTKKLLLTPAKSEIVNLFYEIQERESPQNSNEARSGCEE